MSNRTRVTKRPTMSYLDRTIEYLRTPKRMLAGGQLLCFLNVLDNIEVVETYRLLLAQVGAELHSERFWAHTLVENYLKVHTPFRNTNTWHGNYQLEWLYYPCNEGRVLYSY